MKLDQDKITKQLPVWFSSLRGILEVYGLIPILIGGSVRDFLLTGSFGNDWDFEIVHPSLKFNLKFWQNLAQDLKKLGDVSILPYEVIRVKISDHEIELSPPRKELFLNTLVSNGHKNFKAEFDFSLPFEESVRRRDFTINAMGFKFSKNLVEFIDPLDGYSDLTQKLLVHCGENFSKDPVRLLRAIRFHLKFHLEYSSQLKEELLKMKDINFSSTYLWNEMKKSQAPLDFYLELLNFKDLMPGLDIPILSGFNENILEFKKLILSPESFLSWEIALCFKGIDTKHWNAYFKNSNEVTEKIHRWIELLKKVSIFKRSDFHSEFHVLLKDENFKLFVSWFIATKNLMQKNEKIDWMKTLERLSCHWGEIFYLQPTKDCEKIIPKDRTSYQVWELCQRLS